MTRWQGMVTGAVVLVGGWALVAGARPSPQQIAAERAAVFAQADADGDGALTREEFTSFTELVHARMQDHRFAHADADGDGKVTLAEVEAAAPPHGRCHGPDAVP